MTYTKADYKRALEMACKDLAAYCRACPLYNKKEKRCGGLHKGFCHIAIRNYQIKLAKGKK